MLTFISWGSLRLVQPSAYFGLIYFLLGHTQGGGKYSRVYSQPGSRVIHGRA